MLGLEHDFRVVDVDVRLGGASRRYGPDALEREMRQAGVVRSLVAPPAGDAEGYLEANNAVARNCVDRPFVPVARLNGVRDADPGPGGRLRNLAARRDDRHTAPEDVKRYAYGDRFAGFALDPAADGLPDEAVLDALAAVERPLVVGVGRSFPPAAVERHLLGRGVPVVLAAGARPLAPGRARAAIDLLGDHGGVFVDTACLRRRAALERALREHPDRVVFGSGAPAVHPNVAVMAVLTLDVPEDAMRRVFDRNAARLVDALAAE